MAAFAQEAEELPIIHQLERDCVLALTKVTRPSAKRVKIEEQRVAGILKTYKRLKKVGYQSGYLDERLRERRLLNAVRRDRRRKS